jgi:hypothetical protein
MIDALNEEKESLKRIEECIIFFKICIERNYNDVIDLIAQQVFKEKFSKLSQNEKKEVVRLLSSELIKEIKTDDISHFVK